MPFPDWTKHSFPGRSRKSRFRHRRPLRGTRTRERSADAIFALESRSLQSLLIRIESLRLISNTIPTGGAFSISSGYHYGGYPLTVAIKAHRGRGTRRRRRCATYLILSVFQG